MAWSLCTASLLVFAAMVHAQTMPSQPPTEECNPDPKELSNPLEVRSDLQGVDFHSYLGLVLAKVKQNWYSVIPEAAQAPTKKKGCVALDFEILRDGSVARERFVHSSHDDSLDRAAWSGIKTSFPFPQLPVSFPGDHIDLRFRFYYNPENAVIASSPVTVALASETGDPPRSIYLPAPRFSSPSVRAHNGDTGVFRLVVTKKGSTKHVKVLDSLDKECDRVSIATIKTCKFEPTVHGGKAVEVPLTARVTLNW
jgi:TonB family protein